MPDLDGNRLDNIMIGILSFLIIFNCFYFYSEFDKVENLIQLLRTIPLTAYPTEQADFPPLF